jgi:CHAT domain-containing protein/Tfp pilus assembly protein PilF
MFDNFTEKAIDCLMKAQEETQNLGHREVSTIQILLGLIIVEDQMCGELLSIAGITLSKVRNQLPVRGNWSNREISFDYNSHLVFNELAVNEAKKLNDTEIDTYHLLLGLLRQPHSKAIKALQELGIEPVYLRTQIYRKLSDHGHPVALQLLQSISTNPNESNRIKASIDLIKVLLERPKSPDTEILRNHIGIIDATLIEGVALILQEKDPKGAEYLRRLVAPQAPEVKDIDKSVEISSEEKMPDKGLDIDKGLAITDINSFLFQLLRIAFESKIDKDVIYPFLINNIDKLLDRKFPEVFRKWSVDTLNNIGNPKKQELARRIFDISDLIEEFPYENESLKREIAIIGYKAVADFFLKQVSSQNSTIENSSKIKEYEQDKTDENIQIEDLSDQSNKISENEPNSVLDQERYKAYLYLIQELRTSAPSHEKAILASNPDLLDDNLVAIMSQMAVALENSNEIVDSRKLQNLASYVTQLIDSKNSSKSNLANGTFEEKTVDAPNELKDKKGDEKIFDRFSGKAVKAIILAQSEANRLGHSLVDPEHILLGLIAEGTDYGALLLRDHDINLKRARVEIEKLLGKELKEPISEIPFSSEGRLVIQSSLSIANDFHIDQIEIVHVLISILSSDQKIVNQILIACNIDPKAFLNFIQGMEYFNADDPNSALKYFEKAIKIKNDYSLALTYSGIAQRKLKLFSSALVNFEKAIQYNFLGAWRHKGLLLQEMAALIDDTGRQEEVERKHIEAILCFEKILEQYPKSTEALNHLAISLKAINRYPEALRYYTQALEIDPNDAATIFNRASLLIELKNWDMALVDFDRVLSIDPEDFASWLTRADVLFELQRFEDAIESYNKSISINPNIFEAWLGRGRVWSKIANEAHNSMANFFVSKEVLINFYKAWEISPGSPITTQLIEKIEESMFRNVPTAYLEELARALTMDGQESLARFIYRIVDRQKLMFPEFAKLDDQFTQSIKTFDLLGEIFSEQPSEAAKSLKAELEEKRNKQSALIDTVFEKLRDEGTEEEICEYLRQNSNLIDASILPLFNTLIVSLLEDPDNEGFLKIPEEIYDEQLALCPFPLESFGQNIGNKIKFLTDFNYFGNFTLCLTFCFHLKSVIDVEFAEELGRTGFELLLIVQCIRLGILDINNEDTFLLLTLESFREKTDAVHKYLEDKSSFDFSTSDLLQKIGLFYLANIATENAKSYKDDNKHIHRNPENIERAILSFKVALGIWRLSVSNKSLSDCYNNIYLQFFNHIESINQHLANTLLNLGNIYFDRKYGNPEDNFLESIILLEEAQTLDFEDDSLKGKIKTGLAIANRRTGRGNPRENLEISIKTYLEQLAEREPFTLSWANTKKNLAVAYSEKAKYELRGSEERLKYLSEAIHANESALKVFEKLELEEEQAELLLNHGNHYFAYALEQNLLLKKKESLDKSIACHERAIDIYEKKRLNERSGEARCSLGVTYHCLGRLLNDVQFVEKSIGLFNQALQAYSSEYNPYDFARIHMMVGSQFLGLDRCFEAYNTLKKGVAALEEYRTIHIMNDATVEDKQKHAESFGSFYHCLVSSCIGLRNVSYNYSAEAIEVAERGKAQNLVELLSNKEAFPNSTRFTQAKYNQICNQLQQFRQQIPAKQRQFQLAENKHDKELLVKELKNLQNLKDELINEINNYDDEFKYSQKVQAISYQEIQALVDEKTVILEWYFTTFEMTLFIVTANSKAPIIHLYSQNDVEILESLIKEYSLALQNHDKKSFIRDLTKLLKQLSEVLAIEEIVEKFELKRYQNLILVPHRVFHILPLHALPFNDGRSLMDRFCSITYVPSIQLLQIINKRKKATKLSSAFIVENPSNSNAKALIGSSLQTAMISKHFDPAMTTIISDAEASSNMLLSRLNQSHCIHFCCHGKYNSIEPLKSALLLADPIGALGDTANLTLGKIFELNLEQCRLIVMAACESGLVDSTSVSDEYIGLPSGFLYAGATTIVSSLWKVDPLATTLLLIKFYKYLGKLNHIGKGDISVALMQSQQWLLNMPSYMLEKIHRSPKLQQYFQAIGISKKEQMQLTDLLQGAIKRKPYPFANPYYWASFVAIGL